MMATDTTQDASASEPSIQIQIIAVTPFQQNCSLIWNKASLQGVVVDPGGDVDRIMAAIAASGAKVQRILLTHGHTDHVGGAAELAERLAVPVEGPHEADRMLIERVEDQARQFGMTGARKVEPDRWLVDGDTVDIAGESFEVLHCPGHAPGHVVYFSRTMRFAISGDVIFAGSVGRSDLPGGDHATLIKAIKDKLLPLGDDVTFLPGHGPASTFGEERLHNPYLK